MTELEPWRDARLKCAIGHEYAGRVRTVQHVFQSDCGPIEQPPSKEFDPPRCVVCGLVTNTLL
jgi:hypothetical protein